MTEMVRNVSCDSSGVVEDERVGRGAKEFPSMATMLKKSCRRATALTFVAISPGRDLLPLFSFQFAPWKFASARSQS